MSIQCNQLTDSSTPGNIYASTGNSVVSTVYFCNTSAADVTINVWAVPASGTYGAGNQIYKTLTIAAYDTYIMDVEKLILGQDDSLQANCSASSSVTATVSYIGA